MKKLVTFSALVATLLLTGCNDSPETVAEKYMDIAISGNLDEIKTVSTNEFYYGLRSEAEDCLMKGLKSKDKKNEDFVKDTTKAIKDAIKDVGVSQKWTALIEAQQKEIRKVLKENNYPIVDECKADTLWKYSEMTDFKILETKINEDNKRAKVTIKAFFKDDDGRVKIKLVNDVEYGWQVDRAPH